MKALQHVSQIHTLSHMLCVAAIVTETTDVFTFEHVLSTIEYICCNKNTYLKSLQPVNM